MTTATQSAPTDPTPKPHVRSITDGGLETNLIFDYGIELEDFAAFPLLDQPDGRSMLTSYFAPYFDLAAQSGVGLVLDTPTWRANRDWGRRLGYDDAALASVNRQAVRFMRSLAANRPDVGTTINGTIGPRGDGYVADTAMTVAEAEAYHALQVDAFDQGGVDTVTAVTMTNVDEAIGIVRACAARKLTTICGFTVETDGRLPSGTPLADAITEVDEATGQAAREFMINCAHPLHFNHVLATGGSWAERIGTIRANASQMSHEELDAMEDLDRGNTSELAGLYAELAEMLPSLHVVGGCCGTDVEHVGAIVSTLWPKSA